MIIYKSKCYFVKEYPVNRLVLMWSRVEELPVSQGEDGQAACLEQVPDVAAHPLELEGVNQVLAHDVELKLVTAAAEAVREDAALVQLVSGPEDLPLPHAFTLFFVLPVVLRERPEGLHRLVGFRFRLVGIVEEPLQFLRK
jgi:hypothetical protein